MLRCLTYPIHQSIAALPGFRAAGPHLPFSSSVTALPASERTRADSVWPTREEHERAPCWLPGIRDARWPRPKNSPGPRSCRSRSPLKAFACAPLLLPFWPPARRFFLPVMRTAVDPRVPRLPGAQLMHLCPARPSAACSMTIMVAFGHRLHLYHP